MNPRIAGPAAVTVAAAAMVLAAVTAAAAAMVLAAVKADGVTAPAVAGAAAAMVLVAAVAGRCRSCLMKPAA